MIVRNSILCLNCKEELVSEYRHDFKVCKCWKETQEKFREWEESLFRPPTHLEVCAWHAENGKGCSVDGGKAYLKRSGGSYVDTSITDDRSVH